MSDQPGNGPGDPNGPSGSPQPTRQTTSTMTSENAKLNAVKANAKASFTPNPATVNNTQLNPNGASFIPSKYNQTFIPSEQNNNSPNHPTPFYPKSLPSTSTNLVEQPSGGVEKCRINRSNNGADEEWKASRNKLNNNDVQIRENNHHDQHDHHNNNTNQSEKVKNQTKKQTICRFFNTPTGCKSGDQCQHIHQVNLSNGNGDGHKNNKNQKQIHSNPNEPAFTPSELKSPFGSLNPRNEPKINPRRGKSQPNQAEFGPRNPQTLPNLQLGFSSGITNSNNQSSIPNTNTNTNNNNNNTSRTRTNTRSELNTDSNSSTGGHLANLLAKQKQREVSKANQHNAAQNDDQNNPKASQKAKRNKNATNQNQLNHHHQDDISDDDNDDYMDDFTTISDIDDIDDDNQDDEQTRDISQVISNISKNSSFLSMFEKHFDTTKPQNAQTESSNNPSTHSNSKHDTYRFQTMIEELLSNEYQCLICMDGVNEHTYIWQCTHCNTITHYDCMKSIAIPSDDTDRFNQVQKDFAKRRREDGDKHGKGGQENDQNDNEMTEMERKMQIAFEFNSRQGKIANIASDGGITGSGNMTKSALRKEAFVKQSDQALDEAYKHFSDQNSQTQLEFLKRGKKNERIFDDDIDQVDIDRYFNYSKDLSFGVDQMTKQQQFSQSGDKKAHIGQNVTKSAQNNNLSLYNHPHSDAKKSSSSF